MIIRKLCFEGEKCMEQSNERKPAQRITRAPEEMMNEMGRMTREELEEKIEEWSAELKQLKVFQGQVNTRKERNQIIMRISQLQDKINTAEESLARKSDNANRSSKGKVKLSNKFKGIFTPKKKKVQQNQDTNNGLNVGEVEDDDKLEVRGRGTSILDEDIETQGDKRAEFFAKLSEQFPDIRDILLEFSDLEEDQVVEKKEKNLILQEFLGKRSEEEQAQFLDLQQFFKGCKKIDKMSPLEQMDMQKQMDAYEKGLEKVQRKVDTEPEQGSSSANSQVRTMNFKVKMEGKVRATFFSKLPTEIQDKMVTYSAMINVERRYEKYNQLNEDLRNYYAALSDPDKEKMGDLQEFFDKMNTMDQMSESEQMNMQNQIDAYNDALEQIRKSKTRNGGETGSQILAENVKSEVPKRGTSIDGKKNNIPEMEGQEELKRDDDFDDNGMLTQEAINRLIYEGKGKKRAEFFSELPVDIQEKMQKYSAMIDEESDSKKKILEDLSEYYMNSSNKDKMSDLQDFFDRKNVISQMSEGEQKNMQFEIEAYEEALEKIRQEKKEEYRDDEAEYDDGYEEAEIKSQILAENVKPEVPKSGTFNSDEQVIVLEPEENAQEEPSNEADWWNTPLTDEEIRNLSGDENSEGINPSAGSMENPEAVVIPDLQPEQPVIIMPHKSEEVRVLEEAIERLNTEMLEVDGIYKNLNKQWINAGDEETKRKLTEEMKLQKEHLEKLNDQIVEKELELKIESLNEEIKSLEEMMSITVKEEKANLMKKIQSVQEQKTQFSEALKASCARHKAKWKVEEKKEKKSKPTTSGKKEEQALNGEPQGEKTEESQQTTEETGEKPQGDNKSDLNKEKGVQLKMEIDKRDAYIKNEEAKVQRWIRKMEGLPAGSPEKAKIDKEIKREQVKISIFKSHIKDLMKEEEMIKKGKKPEEHRSSEREEQRKAAQAKIDEANREQRKLTKDEITQVLKWMNPQEKDSDEADREKVSIHIRDIQGMIYKANQKKKSFRRAGKSDKIRNLDTVIMQAREEENEILAQFVELGGMEVWAKVRAQEIKKGDKNNSIHPSMEEISAVIEYLREIRKEEKENLKEERKSVEKGSRRERKIKRRQQVIKRERKILKKQDKEIQKHYKDVKKEMRKYMKRKEIRNVADFEGIASVTTSSTKSTGNSSSLDYLRDKNAQAAIEHPENLVNNPRNPAQEREEKIK